MQGIRNGVAGDDVMALGTGLASSSCIHTRRVPEGGIFATAKARTLQELRMLARSWKKHQDNISTGAFKSGNMLLRSMRGWSLY